MSDEPTREDQFLVAADRVADVLDREPAATFPHDPSQEFRAAARGLCNQIARIRFEIDGGDPDELDALDVEDPAVVINLEDLRSFVEGFHADGDQRRFAACAAVFDWMTRDWELQE